MQYFRSLRNFCYVGLGTHDPLKHITHPARKLSTVKNFVGIELALNLKALEALILKEVLQLLSLKGISRNFTQIGNQINAFKISDLNHTQAGRPNLLARVGVTRRNSSNKLLGAPANVVCGQKIGQSC